jgi:hypothetical protein
LHAPSIGPAWAKLLITGSTTATLAARNSDFMSLCLYRPQPGFPHLRIIMWNHYGVKRGIFQEPGHKAQIRRPRSLVHATAGQAGSVLHQPLESRNLNVENS